MRRLIDVADQSLYDAVTDTATPHLNQVMVPLSNAANNSRVWLISAAALARR